MPVGAICRFPDSATAAGTIPGLLKDGDLVLLKASRGIHLETVAQAVMELRERAAQDHRKRHEFFRKAAS
jgi:hypothetical protein